jgi:uncharacterized protein (DUF1501 family)
MTGHGAKFGRKMEEAIAALLIQRNIEEAAKSVGVSPKTLRRWQQVPEFDAAYRKAKRDAFGQSVARLLQVSSAAVTTLQRLIVDPNTPAAVKARAAYYILTLSTKAIEDDDIVARLTVLEEAAEQNKSDKRK